MSHATADIVPVCLAVEEASSNGKLNNPGDVRSFQFTFNTEPDLITFTKALFLNGFHKTENIIRDGLNLQVKIDN